MSTSNFTGLSMPVFAAFGWAGEETALKFAYSQLEVFINMLHNGLPRSVQAEFPAYGLSKENRCIYLAANTDVERDAHLLFFTRPMSLEIQLVVTNKEVLSRGLTLISKDPINSHHLITQLGPEWTLRVQQMLYEEESRNVSHYQDLFKESLAQLHQATAVDVFGKAAYLNDQEKWVTPIYLSRRFDSEYAAAMGPAIIQVLSDQIEALIPVYHLISGRVGKKPGRQPTKRLKPKARATAKPAEEPLDIPEIALKPQEEFTYIADLKPLHIRRGFINMTPQHWPFFAVNARTETRDVSVYYEGLYDKKSAVWRLQPDETARLVLGPAAHEWLEDNFGADDRIMIQSLKLDNDEIQVTLSHYTE